MPTWDPRGDQGSTPVNQVEPWCLSLVLVALCGQTYHPRCIRPSGRAMKLSVGATLRWSTFSWGCHANWVERIGGRTLPHPSSQGRMKWNGKITLTITWVITTGIIVIILCLLSFLCSETVGETGFWVAGWEPGVRVQMVWKRTGWRSNGRRTQVVPPSG